MEIECEHCGEVSLSGRVHKGYCILFGLSPDPRQSGGKADTSDLKSDAEKHSGSNPGSGTQDIYSNTYAGNTEPEHDKDYRIIELSSRRKCAREYLQLTVDAEDYIQTANAAIQILEIEAELNGLKFK